MVRQEIVSVCVVHRTRQHDGRLVLFGIPSLLLLSRNATRSDLRNRALQIAKELCPQSIPKLVVCGVTGLRCCECRNKQCEGCELPNDDAPVAFDPGRHLLVLNWNSEECAAAWKGFPEPELHPSVIAARAEGEEKISLRQCFDALQTPQQLSEGNELTCDSCGKKTRATLTERVVSVGSNLLVQLHRFPRRELSDKLDIVVEYEEGFQIAGSSLRLSAVVCHIGARSGSLGTSGSGGHYIAFVRRGDKWFKCNDAVVSKVALEHVLSNRNAYLLLYTKE